MAAGDTCTVYAGTYTGNVTVPAGTAGNYKTITVNGSDVVNVSGEFTLNSHTKLIGNCTKPAAPGTCGFSISTPSQSGGCLTATDGSTDFSFTNNVFFQCGLGNDVIASFQGTTGVSFVTIQGNTFSYGCGTSAAPNNCVALGLAGNHILVQNNDFSHFGIVIEAYGQYEVIRNNSFHDIYESECGSASGNCHMDMIYAERSNTAASDLVQYQLWEGNTATTVVGVDGKGLWTAADNPSGCGTSCFNVIGRYNVFAHFGSGMSSHTSGFLNVKWYNNSWIDPNNAALGSPASTSYRDDTSTGGGEINELYYYPQSVPSSWDWSPYALNSGADATGFTAGANGAYCSATPCTFSGSGGSPTPFPNDTVGVFTPNVLFATDPLANYSGGNYNLAAGSPALAAGTYQTTVASADTGTGTSLIVTDAAFFQDGLGLNSAGVQPDCVAVNTASNHVCVTAVNYSTNTLTLASSISRSSGQGVYLYSKSDGAQVLTGSAPNIGALGGGPSFTCAPTTIPENHSGNIPLPCTGSGTSWTGSTAFTASGACTYVSTSNTSGTSQTVTVTTGGSTGTCTITDSTDSISTTVTVSVPSLAMSPVSGNVSTTPSETFTGTNSVWSLDVGAGGSYTTSTLFTVSGGSCSGESLGTASVSSNSAALATLTTGSAACTITVTDNSTTATTTFTVNAVSSSTPAVQICPTQPCQVQMSGQIKIQL